MALNFPNGPSDGDTYEGYVWNATVGAWQSTFTGGGGSIEASSTAPSDPSNGDLWWDTDNGNLYIYYDDGDSQQWVAANGPQVFVGTSAPAGYQGQLWFDSTEGKTYIYYDDGTSAQWVSAIGGFAGGLVAVKSELFTGTQTASVASQGNVAVTDLSITHEVSDPANKLIISAFFGAAALNDSRGNVGIAVHDGTTLLALGDASGNHTSVTAGGAIDSSSNNTVVTMPSITFVHTPGAGSKTYTVRAINIGGNTETIYINRNQTDNDREIDPRAVSSLVIQEVAV